MSSADPRRGYLHPSNHTRVKDFPHGHGDVASVLEVLREGGEVPGLHPPVGVEVIEAGGVRPSSSQEGHTAGGAHGLL